MSSIIKFDNEKINNDSLSSVAERSLDSIVRNNNSFEVVALKPDSAHIQPLNAEILEIFNTMLKNHSISNITIPPKIVQIINEHDQRFYMATLIEGFDRTGGNFAKVLTFADSALKDLYVIDNTFFSCKALYNTSK